MEADLLNEPEEKDNIFNMAKAKLTMDELLAGAEGVKRATAGETVTGNVLSVRKHEILVDLGARGVGVVPRREVSFREEFKCW